MCAERWPLHLTSRTPCTRRWRGAQWFTVPLSDVINAAALLNEPLTCCAFPRCFPSAQPLIAAPIKGEYPLTPACAFSHMHSGITSNQLQEGCVHVCVCVQYLSRQQLKFNYHASKRPLFVQLPLNQGAALHSLNIEGDLWSSSSLWIHSGFQGFRVSGSDIGESERVAEADFEQNFTAHLSLFFYFKQIKMLKVELKYIFFIIESSVFHF